jgi:hypothetical protein
MRFLRVAGQLTERWLHSRLTHKAAQLRQAAPGDQAHCARSLMLSAFICGFKFFELRSLVQSEHLQHCKSG